MMLPLLLSVLATAHGHAASPDTFWVLPAKSQKDAQAEPIRGALIAEDATHYHVRVEGGELWIEKKLVQRVEKDALTVEEIAKKEQEKRDSKTDSATEATAVEAATKPAEAAPSEATTPAAEPAAEAAPQQDAADTPRYDPVLHRMSGTSGATAAQRIAELREAYRITRSQETRKELRRARRGL